MREGGEMHPMFDWRDRARQNAEAQSQRYAEGGVTPQIVAGLLTKVLHRQKGIVTREDEALQQGGWEYDESMYVNSSDPLPEVGKLVEAKEKVVATVAGAGDFPALFLYGGAKEVKIFDVSCFAGFWTEAKLQAAAILSFEEYKEFLGSSDVTEWDVPKEGEVSLFQQKHYAAIQPFLSEQARTFFDALQTEEYDSLMKRGQAPAFEGGSFSNKEFLRFRYGGFVNRCIPSEEEYGLLQQKIREGHWSIEVMDGAKFAQKHAAEGIDFFYISNIGIQPQHVLRTAMKFYQAGAQKVIFTALNELSQFDPSITYRWDESIEEGETRVHHTLMMGDKEVTPGNILSSHHMRFKVLTSGRGEVIGELYPAYDGPAKQFTQEHLIDDVKSWVVDGGVIGRYAPEVLEKARGFAQEVQTRDRIRKELADALTYPGWEFEEEVAVTTVTEKVAACCDLLEIDRKELDTYKAYVAARGLLFGRSRRSFIGAEKFYGITRDEAREDPAVRIEWRKAVLEEGDLDAVDGYLGAPGQTEDRETFLRAYVVSQCERNDFHNLFELITEGGITRREVIRLYKTVHADASGVPVKEDNGSRYWNPDVRTQYRKLLKAIMRAFRVRKA